MKQPQLRFKLTAEQLVEMGQVPNPEPHPHRFLSEAQVFSNQKKRKEDLKGKEQAVFEFRGNRWVSDPSPTLALPRTLTHSENT